MMMFIRPILYLLPSISLQLIQDKSTFTCFLYLALNLLRFVIASLAALLTWLTCFIFAIPISCIIFVSFLVIILYILIYLNSNKPEVLFKWFKLFLILHFCLLAIILICNSSDLALRLYPLDSIFINIFNNSLISCFYYYTILASLSLYIYSCLLYNVKLKDSYSSYDYYLSCIYVLYITYQKRITWDLIFNIILILVVYILLRYALIYYLCYICGVEVGIYIIYIINITFMYILSFLYNKLYKLREEKPIIAVLLSLLKTWVLAILIFELNMYLFGGLFIAYLCYIFFGDVIACHPTNILSFDDYSGKAEAISKQDNISKLEKSNLLTDEVIRVENDINKNTLMRQVNSDIALPYAEVPSLIFTFDQWYRGLKPYTDLLFSSAGESAVQDNILFSRYFPNSLGVDNLRFQPGFLQVHRTHALAVLQFYTQIYKVKFEWSLCTYDLLSDPRDYPTYGPGSAKIKELETRDLDQYVFIKNIVQKLGDANFNSKIEEGATSAHHVIQSLQDHMHDLEKMATKMESLYLKSNKNFHEISEVEHNSFSPMVTRSVLAGHLPLFKSQGIVLPFQIVFFGDAH